MSAGCCVVMIEPEDLQGYRELRTLEGYTIDRACESKIPAAEVALWCVFFRWVDCLLE